MSHGENLAPVSAIEAKKLRVREAEIMGKAMLITGVIFATQAVILKYFIPSLALEGDTFHTASDFLINIGSFVIAFIAINEETKGTKAIRRWFAYFGIAVLIYGIIEVCIGAYTRLSAPVVIQSGWLMVVGLVGGLGNFWVHKILDSVPSHHQTDNHKALNTHVVSDMLLSVVVVLSGLITLATGWHNADPALSFLSALVMIVLTWKLFQGVRSGACAHGHRH